MPFVKRDSDGRIVNATREPTDDVAEEVAIDDPALRAFLAENVIDALAMREWVMSDLSLARVFEDLVEVLIEKNVIRITDLPAPAQRKLTNRRGLRKELAYVQSLFGDDFGEDGAYNPPDDGTERLG